MKIHLSRTLILVTLLALCTSAVAATKIVCVGSAAELTTALSTLPTSTANSDATDIRVRVGVYASPDGGWAASVTNHHDLTLRGGYQDAQCEQRNFDASLTVLDAHHSGTVLAIDTVEIPSSSIEISGLTFQNGDATPVAFGNSAGGLKIGDPGPIHGGNVLVERNIFRDNSSSSPGAGGLLAASDGTSVIVRGNLFAGNSAGTAAGALLFSNNEIDVSNNTFVHNQSTDTTLAQRVVLDFFTFGGLKLDNNIFWDNVVGDGAFDIDLHGQARGATAINNNIQAKTGTPAQEINTLHIDPGFVAPDDFRLSAQSALINAGENAPPGGTADVDLTGSDRVVDGVIDLGAYEFNGSIFGDGFEIGGFTSGNWYNPQQGGHGFQLEVTTTGQMLAIWFVYTPDGSGQNWIYAQGPYDPHANTVTLPAQILTGARFPPNFHSADVHQQGGANWGSLTFTFTDCDNGRVSWHSDQPGYDKANDTPLPITRLTQIAGTVCPA